MTYSGDADFDVGGFFEPYVLQWLVDTDNKTTQWVQAVRNLVASLIFVSKHRM